MGRGTNATEATSKQLLFGPRVRGNGPTPIDEATRRELLEQRFHKSPLYEQMRLQGIDAAREAWPTMSEHEQELAIAWAVRLAQAQAIRTDIDIYEIGNFFGVTLTFDQVVEAEQAVIEEARQLVRARLAEDASDLSMINVGTRALMENAFADLILQRIDRTPETALAALDGLHQSEDPEIIQAMKQITGETADYLKSGITDAEWKLALMQFIEGHFQPNAADALELFDLMRRRREAHRQADGSSLLDER